MPEYINETKEKKKWQPVIIWGLLAVVLIIGLGLFWEYASTFIPENSLTIVKETNNENSIELVGDAGKTSTTFYFNRWISPRGKGLQESTTYAYRVINKSGDVVIPLDKWPVFKIKADGSVVQRGIVINWIDKKGVALHGGFNQEGWLPLSIGDYIIQLVKIEKPKGVIVAERDFSIIPYDKQMLSKLTAYLTVEGDPNKYYDSYTKKGSDSVTVQVQSPKGEVISGKMKSFMTDLNGKIEEISWVGVSEAAFRTDPSGEPVSLTNLSGNPPPGIYHYEIIVDGNVVFDLKYVCSVPSL